MPKGVYLHKKGRLPTIGMTGKHHSEETKRKMNLVHKGRKLSQETRKKISETIKNRSYLPHLPWNKGKKCPHSEEWKKKIGLLFIGNNNPNWRGGITHNPYSVDWTKTLRKSIRERDHYTCQICGKEPSINCHHIDYNKQNSNPNNLIILCHSCHIKTNYNRKYWIKFFEQMKGNNS